MPVRVRCSLGIGGRLAAPPAENGPILQRLRRILPDKAPRQDGSGWPAGLAPASWQITQWTSRAEVGGEDEQETRITFRVELSTLQEGTIYDARDALEEQFRAFVCYRDALWHKDLKTQLEELNEEIVKRHGYEKLIEKIWFREWQFTCGNGGDH
jgi:hypothetical protein